MNWAKLIVLFVLSGSWNHTVASATHFSVNDDDRRAEFERLHVDVPNSCDLISNQGKDTEGPFQRTIQCDDRDFKNLKKISGYVYRVVDGDTIHFYVGRRLYAIRMLGIDTPELHYHGKSQPIWGLRARDHLRSMVQPHDYITVEFDQMKCDYYGRILGHVYRGNVNLNFEQVRGGFASNYCIAPNLSRCESYSLAYSKAQKEGLGIHQDRCQVTPYVWRRALDRKNMDKNVMDARTQKVYSPSEYYLVPVQYRIFYPIGK